jgi:hypothetical protein
MPFVSSSPQEMLLAALSSIVFKAANVKNSGVLSAAIVDA